MKALSVKQPWALLIVNGVKDIENRTRKTNYRGRILIHASGKPDKIELEMSGQATVQEMQMFSVLNKVEENELFGCVIGSVEIVDCVKNNPSVWAEKNVWNWVLTNPVLFKKPIRNIKGKLGLWEASDEILHKVKRECPSLIGVG